VTTPAAFLFDLDGTLADTLADIAASTNHVRRQHGLPALPDAAVRAFVGDGARTLLRRALADVLVKDPAAMERQLDDAFAAYAAHHRGQCTVHARLYPGVREHLERWRERGHRLGVVTNKPEQFARPLLAHLGLDDLLGVLVGGDSLPQK
jgi:phosphoglycolate phosphatase